MRTNKTKKWSIDDEVTTGKSVDAVTRRLKRLDNYGAGEISRMAVTDTMRTETADDRCETNFTVGNNQLVRTCTLPQGHEGLHHDRTTQYEDDAPPTRAAERPVEADPDNDEFQCEKCKQILDIENSVRQGDDLVCSDCARPVELSPDDALHLAIKSTDSGFLLDIVDDNGQHRALSMKQDGDWLKLEPVVPARHYATLLRQKRELVEAAAYVSDCLLDSTFGEQDPKTWARILRTALNAAVGEGEGGRDE